MRSLRRSSNAVLLAAVTFVLALAASPAADAVASGSPSCLREGDSVEHRGLALLITHRLPKGEHWFEGSARVYVCSPAYKKRVYVGVDDEDAALARHRRVFLSLENRRFAVVLNGLEDFAGGIITDVATIDLKRGRKVANVALQQPEDFHGPPQIEHLALGRTGALGLIVHQPHTPPASETQILRIFPGGQLQTVAVGDASIGYFLRFADDQRTLIWSTSTHWNQRELVAAPIPRGLEQGHCLRSGEMRVYRRLGQMIVRRPITPGNWSNGYVLYACSYVFKRRTPIARFARCRDRCTRVTDIEIDSKQIAVATRTVAPGGVTVATDIRFVSLATGEVFYAGPVSTTDPLAEPLRMLIHSNGILAWIAERSAPNVQYEVNLRDENGMRTVDTAAFIDPDFFDEGLVNLPDQPGLTDLIRWSTATASG